LVRPRGVNFDIDSERGRFIAKRVADAVKNVVKAGNFFGNLHR
jgi:hypothetical protein